MILLIFCSTTGATHASAFEGGGRELTEEGPVSLGEAAQLPDTEVGSNCTHRCHTWIGSLERPPDKVKRTQVQVATWADTEIVVERGANGSLGNPRSRGKVFDRHRAISVVVQAILHFTDEPFP